MGFSQVEFDRLWNLAVSQGNFLFSHKQKYSFRAEMSATMRTNPVICRYKMQRRDWSDNSIIHPVPFDIEDFCEGIGNYSQGMIIIATPGFYQVNAMLGNVRLRIRKNSRNYSHSYNG